ncbi:MAG: flagellar biosynthesis protein FlhB [Thermomonas hydrothermalis]|uniref:flagellar biosynthesis protein FlhB n=1 Tax=Thermomonas hydrothermalis TaxID=213588 RepID=UPI002352C387|nr:flagellar biosynthesis protein FlhB [Thermomonas hydrothermalis]MCL6618453.1 flagellar biosynthesis protein FlhB [Thermomonas hydrothermalis]
MSQAEDREDRTEAPTSKRLEDARKRGDTPRSRELANVAVLGTSVLGLLALGPMLATASLGWMRQALAFDPALIGHEDRLLTHAAVTLAGLALPALPLVGLALLASLIAPAVMGGLRFSAEALQPNFNRLNPLQGLARMYGREGRVELLRSLLRVLLVGGVGYAVMHRGLLAMPALQRAPMERAIADGLSFMVHALAAMVGAMALLALLDVPYQRWAWRDKLKMTRQEVRDEYKELEGNPQVKSKLRQMAMRAAQRRMMEAVPKADVVVVNPTHYAVALKYEPGKMRAPKVVASGVDEIALKIREIARAHRVTQVEAPPLARALYRHAKLDQEIPVALYAAVAQVLSYVYQLRRWHPSHGPMPHLPAVTLDPSLDDGLMPR